MSRARDLARLACELQARIDALPDHVDPSWLQPADSGDAATARSDALPPQVRGALSKDWFARHCRPLPPLDRLEDSGARLALMDRTSLLARLCALALLGRPGVLRCCVQRSARTALQQTLGPAFASLRARDGGAAVSPEVAAWPPLAWSWVGYRELVRAGAWPDRALQRMVRLALPASRSDAPSPRLVPRASETARERLRALESLFSEGCPC
ncbi:type III secretion protein HrpB4 [Paracidovorax citrulli]|uniref:type III secretion protein HrpB4 n=1 Tax=Paracidovorax citrulli TaxID=80869 RepID=UPI000662792A|nr:type III secretion protein HrpB4 [Paracidovorax citrulli]QCX11147.1 type III secretion protein HrpB4 [Paracidovorax citrulli]UEG45881.1 type III secretion protein [Paracidovorax citrulli]UMT86823.1 type III secretion protein [Paracidovorax citrulli]UMT94864.1 type III secretion protein [Paracidovorax citrulli]WIY34336.1 type III secretion protein HrpB4 [Paracidovorax citrulli]